MKNETEARRRAYDPFDVSARVRQYRMGLLDKYGQVNTKAMEVFSRVYAGLFYDNLIDSCGNKESATAVCRALIEQGRGADARQVLLAISMEYDAMHRPLPEPVWWIVGSEELLPPFIDGFTERLKVLLRESEADEV